MSTSQRAERHINNGLSVLAGNGEGAPPSAPPVTSAGGGESDGDKDALIQHIATMVKTARHLPDFGLIKAEIAADRREAEVAEKTELLKLRNAILEDVRPFIDLMRKERPDDAEY